MGDNTLLRMSRSGVENEVVPRPLPEPLYEALSVGLLPVGVAVG